MKNYVTDGNALTVTAPAAVSAGAGVLIGSIFGVAANDAASGAEVIINTQGVYDLAKTAAQARCSRSTWQFDVLPLVSPHPFGRPKHRWAQPVSGAGQRPWPTH